MKSLCKLSISCNNVTELHQDIGAVTSLQFLDVSFNQLHELPASFSNLRQLEAFNGGFNPLGHSHSSSLAAGGVPGGQGGRRVGDFPPAIFQLLALRELNLDHTGCCNIDERFGRLEHLKAIQVPSSLPSCAAVEWPCSVHVAMQYLVPSSVTPECSNQ
jgi:Leucine-rich repeat (LRR) protein